MTFPEGLIDHATRLLGDSRSSARGLADNVDRRRAVSAAYYAVFHHLSGAAVAQIAPQAHQDTANRIHRWLDHTEMKRICGEFASSTLRTPLREIVGNSASPDIQTVAASFIKLQGARHSADYDLSYQLSWTQTDELIKLAANAIAAWDRVAPSSESNVFVLYLVLWKKWELARG